MHAGWQRSMSPNWRRDSEIGLVPVGSALLVENFDQWVLGRGRGAGWPHRPTRTGASGARFLHAPALPLRCVRPRRARQAGRERQRLLAAGLALARAAGGDRLRDADPAARVQYDNPAARTIIASVDAGIPQFGPISRPGFAATRDLIATPGVVRAGDAARPDDPDIGRPLKTGALRRRLGRRRRSGHCAALGTALDIDHEAARLLRAATCRQHDARCATSCTDACDD